MPTAYFHPFQAHQHYIGIGPHAWCDLPSWVSLHGVAPHITKVHHKYLWKLGANSNTFQNYNAATDRIYVMGHCGPGFGTLTTEVDNPATPAHHACTVPQLANALADHGLDVNSSVHIRIHACNSATSSAAGAADSFAEQLRDLMKGAMFGYNNVTIRGYDCAVGVYLGWRWGGLLPANLYAHDYV